MASLQALPEELIGKIVEFLDYEPPSTNRLHDVPALAKPVQSPGTAGISRERSFFRTDEPPLKALSLVCKWFRRSVFDKLFRHIHVDITHNLVDLHMLLCTRNFVPKVESVLIVAPRVDGMDPVESDCPIHGLAWKACIKAFEWFHMSTLTLALPPAAIGSLVAEDIDQRQAWAFQIPFQILRLEWQQDALAYSDPESIQSMYVGDPIYPSRPSSEANILTLRPWTHLTFNAGSSVPAYSNYEHFLLVHPHWLGTTDTNLTSSSNLDSGFDGIIHRHMRNIVYFTFIGVFPYGAIIAELLQLLLSLEALKVLRVRLLPTPAGHGKLEGHDFGRAETQDLWQEFGDALDKFEEILTWEKFGLQGVQFLDYTNSGPIADIIDEHTDAMEDSGWRDRGLGIWTRELEDVMKFKTSDEAST